MISLLLLALGLAHAQDPVDLGVVDESDLVVVQDLLYPKAGRSEIAFAAGVMPFDAYTWAPTLQVSWETHRSESLSFGAVIGGGYGLKSGTYRELEATHGVAPYAFRYLGSALAGVSWAPVYAKANLDGVRIVHYDLFGSLRGGVTVETSVIPQGGTPVAPTLSAEIGSRVFLGEASTLRLSIRDDVMVQARPLTSSVALKQNVGVYIGLGLLSPRRSQ